MYCVNCGTKLGDNVKYCSHCGTEVEKYENLEKIKDVATNTEEVKNNVAKNFNVEHSKTKNEINNETSAQGFMSWWRKQDKESKVLCIVVCVTVAAILLLATYCSNRNDLVGSWSNGNGTTVFDANGNFTMDGDMGSGTYEISGTQLILTSVDGTQHTYTFSIEDDVLTITYESGKTEVLYRGVN